MQLWNLLLSYKRLNIILKSTAFIQEIEYYLQVAKKTQKVSCSNVIANFTPQKKGKTVAMLGILP